MAEKSTVARPYAQAVFELANSQGKLAEWSQMLAAVAQVVGHEKVNELISDTNVQKEVAADLVIDIAGETLSAEGKNFVRVLSDNRRLALLPAILDQYEMLRAEVENTVEAEMLTAKDVPADVQKAIVGALEKRLGRKVTLSVRIDEGILGGAVVRAGDLVIDGSAAGRLQGLTNSLIH